MNPPEFYGSKVGEDLLMYLDKVRKITQIMHVTEEESVELDAYQIKYVIYDCYQRHINSTLLLLRFNSQVQKL